MQPPLASRNLLHSLHDSEGTVSIVKDESTPTKANSALTRISPVTVPSPLNDPLSVPLETGFENNDHTDAAAETANGQSSGATPTSTSAGSPHDTENTATTNIDNDTSDNTAVVGSTEAAEFSNDGEVSPDIAVDTKANGTETLVEAVDLKETIDPSDAPATVETKETSPDDKAVEVLQETISKDTPLTSDKPDGDNAGDALQKENKSETKKTSKAKEVSGTISNTSNMDVDDVADADLAKARSAIADDTEGKTTIGDTIPAKSTSQKHTSEIQPAEQDAIATTTSTLNEADDPLSILPADPMLDDLLTPLEKLTSLASFSSTAPTSRNQSFAIVTPQPFLGMSPISSQCLIMRPSLTLSSHRSQAFPSHASTMSSATKLTSGIHQIHPIDTLTDKATCTTTFVTTLNIFLSPTNVPDKQTIIASLDTIFTILRHPTTDRKMLVDTLLQATFDAITAHSEDLHLQMRTTLLLSTTGPHTPILTASLLSSTSLRKLLSLLETHPKNGYIQSRVLATITPIARHPSAIAPLVTHRAIELAVWALEMFKTLRPIVTHVAAILRSICTHGTPCAHTRITRVGALSALTSALTRWSVNPLVQTAIIASISAILEPNSTNQWIAGRISLVQPIVSAMMAKPHNLLLQIVSVRAIAAFTTSFPENRTQAIESEFITAVTQALALFGEDTAIADAFFTAVGNLSDGPTGPDESSITSLSSTQALKTVLHLLHLHAAHDLVSTRGAKCVCFMLRSADIRSRLFPSDGLGSLLSTARTASTGPFATQTEAVFGALANAVYDHAENAEQLVCKGGVSVIATGMHTHVESSGVQRQGLRFLRNACVMTAFSVKLTREAISVMVVALLGHENDKDLQHEACHLLLNLNSGNTGAAARENASFMVSLGMPEALTVIRGLHGNDTALQGMIDNLLHLLGGSSSADIARKVGGEKAVQFVHDKDRVLRRYTIRRDLPSGRERMAIG